MNETGLESATILGVAVNRLSLSDLIEHICCCAATGGRCRVLYANVHVLNNAYGDPELRRILNQANVVYCDGGGVNWAARLLGLQSLRRMTAPDWIGRLCALCAEMGLEIYLLGGRPGVAARAAEILKGRFPGLRVAGSHHGYLSDPQVNEQALNEIKAAAPRILLVGMGTPIQEKWIEMHSNQLQVPVTWAVGALFDFVAGVRNRAPLWMRDHNLEWLYRFRLEPKRLWRRYLVGNPLFLIRVLGQRAGLLKLE